MWAIRNAAEAAGYHSDAKTAQEKYHRIAEEIENSVSSGFLSKRRILISMVDPWFYKISGFNTIVLELLNEFSLKKFPAANREKKQPRFPNETTEKIIRTYENAALMRRSKIGALWAHVSGTITFPSEEADEITIISNEKGEVVQSDLKCSESQQSGGGRKLDFQIDFPLRHHAGEIPEVRLLKNDVTIAQFSTRILLREGEFELPMGDAQTITVMIKQAETIEPRATWRIAIQSLIRKAYNPLLFLGFFASLLGALVGYFRRKSAPVNGSNWVFLSVLVGLMLSSRIFLLAIMNLAVFHYNTRHFFVCAILFPVFLGITVQTIYKLMNNQS
jgi:hypothetical protein